MCTESSSEWNLLHEKSCGLSLPPQALKACQAGEVDAPHVLGHDCRVIILRTYLLRWTAEEGGDGRLINASSVGDG